MFDESKHPRDDEGKFTDGNGRSGSKLEKAIEVYSDFPEKDKQAAPIVYQKENLHKIKHLERKETEFDRIKQIQDNTGMSFEDSKKTYNAIKHYTRAGFRAIRDGRLPEEEKLIENFIEKHPKYDGKIYRGIALNKESADKLILDLRQKKDNGETTDMLGISSWSSAESIANEFANNRAGEYKFIFELDNQSGVGIDHLSEWVGEEEVLQSGKAKYKITDIIYKNGRYKVKFEEV